MNYRLDIKSSARKELEALRDPLLARVDAAIGKPGENPRHPGVIHLKGAPLHRVRIGDRRMLFEIDDKAKSVTIVSITHRRDAYRR